MKLSQHQSGEYTKMLLIGDSGSGKTGSLASLAKAGYQLRIADFDNGLDILANTLKSDPEALDRVEYESYTDKLKMMPGMNTLIPQGKVDSVDRAFIQMEKWMKEATPQTVLVLDSLTMFSNAALRRALQLSGHIGQQPTQPDWGSAIAFVESLLAFLYAEQTKCNVIVLTHIAYQEDATGATLKGYPSALGKKLLPKIGTYFNSCLQVESKNGKRHIRLVPSNFLELKTPLTGANLPATLPIETGLADYFALVRGTTTYQPNQPNQKA